MRARKAPAGPAALCHMDDIQSPKDPFLKSLVAPGWNVPQPKLSRRRKGTVQTTFNQHRPGFRRKGVESRADKR